LLAYETAGDPISGLKWTRKTTQAVADELTSVGIQVSANTVAKLLKKMGYSLRVNHKKRSQCSILPHERDEQFRSIERVRKHFENIGSPIISVDSKKKELIGCFKNPGKVWTREMICVNDHDFRSLAVGIAIPYGIYDWCANEGTVFVGTSHDTAEFASDCLATWWRLYGRQRYPDACHLLILADSGGSNDPRRRAWIYGLQTKLCNACGLTVTVAHYPPGASKWNPADHRLFSEISKNWAGRPLDSYETILNYIATTTTKAGLQVHAHLNETVYATGLKISDEEWAAVHIQRLAPQPKRNYTLIPASETGLYKSTNPIHNEYSYQPTVVENLELIFA
jgi:hypothetical protein